MCLFSYTEEIVKKYRTLPVSTQMFGRELLQFRAYLRKDTRPLDNSFIGIKRGKEYR
jgi:hypothetical protein